MYCSIYTRIVIWFKCNPFHIVQDIASYTIFFFQCRWPTHTFIICRLFSIRNYCHFVIHFRFIPIFSVCHSCILTYIPTSWSQESNNKRFIACITIDVYFSTKRKSCNFTSLNIGNHLSGLVLLFNIYLLNQKGTSKDY